MRKIFLIGITAVGVFANSGASATVTNYGDSDCGAWIKTPTHGAKMWILGYLSGKNSAMGRNNPKYDPLSQISSANQIFVWMDNYCQNNPLEKLSDGGLTLYIELENRIKK
jgi:hypothetical protein